MDSLYPYLFTGFLLLVVGGIALLVFLSKFYKPKQSTLPYTATPLLTEAEKKFFTVLQNAVPENCYVMAQVRLANLVKVKPGTYPFWKYFNPIAMKCVDFVVIRRDTLSPVLVVELDDRSHERVERQARDKFVDEVLALVKLPVMHWPVLSYYDRCELSQVIVTKIQNA